MTSHQPPQRASAPAMHDILPNKRGASLDEGVTHPGSSSPSLLATAVISPPRIDGLPLRVPGRSQPRPAALGRGTRGQEEPKAAGEYGELKHIIKEHGLLEKQPLYYAVK